MKRKNLLPHILAVLTLPLIGTVASASTIDIQSLIDFPGTGNSTLPQKISDQGDIAGILIAPTGIQYALIYKIRATRYSSPFSEPNDTGLVTRGRGINNQRHVCGEYLNASDGTYHGYILEHPNFVEFDIAGAASTIPLGINNAGDLVGTYILADGTQAAFADLHGRITLFSVPGATATFAYQVNTTGQVVGYYVDASGVAHGFSRDKVGNLSYPIDVLGSTGTHLLGNNDSNWAVGSYTDASGVTHGLFFVTPDDILSYDYPGAVSTSLNGINLSGLICGSYLDTAGIYHGFSAKVVINTTKNRSGNLPVTPVKRPRS